MEAIIPLAIFVGFVIIVLTIRQSAKANEAWKKAAKSLGLDFEQGGMFARPKMSGFVDGFGATVRTVTRGSGNSSRTFTVYEVVYPQSLGFELKLTKQGMFSGLKKFFGGRDIVVGDDAFDPNVVVDSGERREVIEFLTPARRMRVRRFLDNRAGATIGDEAIQWETSGRQRDATKIVRAVKSGIAFARGLVARHPRDRQVERALSARGEGRPGAALEILSETPAEVTTDEPAPPEAAPTVEERVLEGELLLLGDRRDEAKRVFEAAAAEEPEDPEIRDWLEQSTDSAEPPAVAPEATPLEVAAVCDALFGADVSSFESSRIFDERYRDREVKWSGVVRRVEDYSIDFVFRGGAGKKVVVEIAQVAPSFGGERAVFAVVQRPKDADEPAVDSPYAFRGRLVKVDGFMRNLYIASDPA